MLLLANLWLASPATLVPHISDVNGFQLEPHDDQYMLRYALIQFVLVPSCANPLLICSHRIRHPDGTSVRNEIVKEVAPGEFEIKGTLNQLFPDRLGGLVVTYEAGRNGYVAKYKYTAEKRPTPPDVVILLSPKLLMSASG